MAGGLLAANRKYFLDVGGYDDKMEIWVIILLNQNFKDFICLGRRKSGNLFSCLDVWGIDWIYSLLQSRTHF